MKTKKWDMAEHIETKADVIAYLEAALEENDIDFLFSVIDDIARSKGMTRIAAELGVTREGLYKAFSAEGNPSFVTVIKVLDNLGFRFKIEQKVSA
jgi:probable addiction module antidote protein